MLEHKVQIAELFLRIFAGILFLFQGYDKLFRVKIKGVVETFSPEASQNHIAQPILFLFAYYTSCVEFFGGMFLLLGFMTTYTLITLGIDLLLVSLAFSFISAMWDMRFLLPRFLLVIVLLVLPDDYRLFCLDRYLF